MIAHLHVHSSHSFLDSTLTPEAVAAVAAERGYEAVALTDTNSLAGAVAFYKACRARGVRPVLGAEIDDPRTGERALVLVRDRTGWGALCRMLTERNLHDTTEPEVVRTTAGVWVKGGRKPCRPSAGTPARTAADGCSDAVAPSRGETFELRTALAALPSAHTITLTDSPALLEFLAPLRPPASTPALYAELILPAAAPPDDVGTDTQRRRARATHDAARRLRLPLVATADVHVAMPEDRALHRLLRAIAHRTMIGRLEWDRRPPRDRNQTARPNVVPAPAPAPAPLALDPVGWFSGPAAWRTAWKGLRGEIEDAIAGIVEACRFELPLGRWHLPRPRRATDDTPFSRLWKKAFAGLQHRHPTLDRETIDRLRHEIETIDRMGFSDYFLVVNEIVEEAWRRGFPVLGRGSAANSLVAYALGFTGVHPLRHGLYFERFLNPERTSPPDIDLDFSWKDRDAILEWVFERFGRDHVALISTTVRLQARQAIREVAKAHGLADAQITRLTRAIPFWHGRAPDLARLDEQFPECRGLPLREEPWRTVLAHAQRLLDFPHHHGIHCGGVVIAPEPIRQYLPLVRSAKGFVVTQMDMGPVEELGLIKIDLLGNRSLGVLKDTLRLIAERNERARE